MTSLSDGEVVVNDIIPIEEPLQPYIRTIISLTPNTQYAIRTYANYMMTGYNADQLLSIFSDLTTTRTLGGLLAVTMYNGSEMLLCIQQRIPCSYLHALSFSQFPSGITQCYSHEDARVDRS